MKIFKKKKNIYLIPSSFAAPFVMVCIDYLLINKKSFVQEQLMSPFEGYVSLQLTIFLLYFAVPGLALLWLLDASRRSKFILSAVLLLTFYPAALLLYLVVGMGVYNVYP